MPQSLSPNCFICLSSFPRLPHQKLTFIYKDRYQGGKKYLQKKTFGVMYLIQTALVPLRLDLNPERRSCNVKFCNGSLEDVLLLECWSTLIKGSFTEIVFRLRGSLRLGGGLSLAILCDLH